MVGEQLPEAAKHVGDRRLLTPLAPESAVNGRLRLESHPPAPASAIHRGGCARADPPELTLNGEHSLEGHRAALALGATGRTGASFPAPGETAPPVDIAPAGCRLHPFCPFQVWLSPGVKQPECSLPGNRNRPFPLGLKVTFHQLGATLPGGCFAGHLEVGITAAQGHQLRPRFLQRQVGIIGLDYKLVAVGVIRRPLGRSAGPSIDASVLESRYRLGGKSAAADDRVGGHQVGGRFAAAIVLRYLQVCPFVHNRRRFRHLWTKALTQPAASVSHLP